MSGGVATKSAWQVHPSPLRGNDSSSESTKGQFRTVRDSLSAEWEEGLSYPCSLSNRISLEDVLDTRMENFRKAVEAGAVEVGKAARNSQFPSAVQEPVHVEEAFIHHAAMDRLVV